jgi:hypothetical protein
MQEYKPGGLLTKAVCPAIVELHAGSPATVLLWICTE